MEVYNDGSVLREPLDFCIALGTFDGVHVAHRAILDACVAEAKKRGWKSLVYTFANHPSEVFCPDDPEEVITTLREKLDLFQEMGFDYAVAVPFDETYATLEPRAFLEGLTAAGGKRMLFCGFDYRFGHEGRGDASYLESLADELGYEVNVQPAMLEGEEVISSTMIREAIRKGELDRAETLLGRRYGGTVKDFGREQSGQSTTIYGLMENKVAPKAGDYAIALYLDGQRLELEAGVYGRNVTILDPEHAIPYEKKRYYVEFEELL